ncbi:MAG: hypothetical protein J6S86_01600 [Alphaproteobacteria bacterium]|nr:hypothetical protein [Alphaproteobacteria bacterium]
MKRVVGLAAFCCMALNVGIVLNVEAESNLEMNSNVREFLRMREEDPDVKKYLKIIKNKNVKKYFEIRRDSKVKEYINKYINRKRNSNIDSNSRDESNNFGYDADNESSDSEQTSKKIKKRKNNRNRKNKNRNRSNRNNVTNKNYQNEFALNEPIIDGAKLQKSSIVVEKDIKLANKDEAKNVEKKISPIELSPLDKKEVLAQNDSAKDLKLAANFDDSKKEIKEKLLQVNNSRKSYNLIRTPNKKLKNNIQVSKFREELDRYRRLYSANLKKA